MGKRAAAACQPPQISQRPRRRRMKTPDDAAMASPTSQAERRPRQEKKRSTARELRRSCATATAIAATQARVRRDAFSVSWGANKRRRTVRSGPALAGNSNSRWRDWAGLDEGPAGLIAERVLANDVADYVRFRSTCLPWRRCCTDPRARGVLEDPRLYPRHWIMLRAESDEDPRLYYLKTAAAASHRRRFLNTRTGQCVEADVPELRDHGVLRATADGLLVLHCKQTESVRVLNPLTRQTAELPPTTDLAEFPLVCAGLLDHGTVYLYSYAGRSGGTMAIARPGDDRWALLDAGPQLIMPSVFFAGRFYGVTYSAIVTVDMSAGDDDGRGTPRMVVAAELPKPFPFSRMTDTVHLVDNGDGDLRLVRRQLRYHGHYTYTVYRVDLSSTGKTTMTCGRRDDLGGRAIFIGYNCGLSVSPRVFPYLSADTIYVSPQCDGHIGAYHVRDGRIEPPCNNRLAHPFSIADSLIDYVRC